MTVSQRLDELMDDFSIFDSWMEKYEYIISLGRRLPALPEEYRQQENLIQGCQSRVWVGFELIDGKMRIHADSDSVITKGLIALFIRLLSDLDPAEIVQADLSRLDASGLREHLASTRANALTAMASTIKQQAQSYLSPTA